jgi:hypothetical protein
MPIDLLEKRITSDWIEVRDKLTTPVRLKAYLKVEDERIAAVPQGLRLCTMTGIVEYKKKIASGVFNFLTRLTYTTPDQDEILGSEAEIRLLLVILGLENQFALGQMKPPKDAEAPAPAAAKTRPPVEEVVAEVKARVAHNPELAKNPHVKNIFMEIQLYQKEFEQFATMSPQIPDDRAPTFFSNYKKRLDGILDNLHAHFREIRRLEGAQQGKEAEVSEENQFAVPELVKLISGQAQEMTKVRSSIFHALQEGYQIRNLLLKLVDSREPLVALFDEELALLDTRQDSSATGHPAAVKLARSVATAFEGPAWRKS